jgi:DNA-binding PucR family transcriptional regulator
MRSAVQQVAERLLPSTPQLGRELAEHVYATIPEFAAADDEELWGGLLATAEAHVGQILLMLEHGESPEDVSVPPEAVSFLRGTVRRDIPLTVMFRGYRLGHAWLWQRWSEELQRQVEDPEALAALLDSSSAFMFAYFDRVCDALAEQFGTEQERMARGADQLRVQAVRSILSAEPVDVNAASRRLGYELRRDHVALRVFSGGAIEVEGLERAVREAAAALGAQNPLVIPSGAARFDVWCGSFEPVNTDKLERYGPPRGVAVAFGKPADGVAGFRTSHAQAVQAARVRGLGRGRTPPVTSYAKVELVSLLACDLPRARTFVADRLGALVEADEAAERLRETVLAFLVSGGSARRVGEQLFVHPNTVAHRITKAEEKLGHGVRQSPVELECALMLAATLGPAVLNG